MSKFLHDINLAQPLSDHPIWQDVRGVWLPVPQLSGGSTLFDLSPYGNHASQSDSTKMPAWTETDGGLALDFDGSNDQITHGNNDSLNVTDGITIAAMLYARSWTNTSNSPILDKFYDGSTRSYFCWGLSGGEIRFGVANTDGSALQLDVSSTAMGMAVDSWHHVAVTWSMDTGYGSFYLNGSLVQTLGSGATASCNANNQQVKIGYGYVATDDRWNGYMAFICLFDRALSNDEVATLYDQSLRGYPDLINRVPTLRHFFMGQVAGGPTYTLTCAQGSYSLTGQTAVLTASRKLAVTQGSYSLTGQAVGLAASRKLAITQGSYSLAGQAVALSASRTIATSQGSYSLTGQDVTLTYSGAGAATYTLTCAQGSYSLTGQVTVLTAARKLAVTQGSYSLTGQAVGLAASRKLALTQGAYALTGQTLGLIIGRVLAASQGSYSLTGQVVTLTYSGADLMPGVEYRVKDSRPHYVVTDGRPHYTSTGTD